MADWVSLKGHHIVKKIDLGFWPSLALLNTLNTFFYEFGIMPWKIDISQFICLLALNLDTNKIHDTCNNTWLRAKQKNIAFKEHHNRQMGVLWSKTHL